MALSCALIAGCGSDSGAENGDNAATDSSSTGSSASNSANGASVAGATSLSGEGATFPAPLYTRWFDAYNKARNVQIDYKSTGSGAGIKQLTAGTVDFGASDAPLKDSEAQKLPSPVAHIPTVAGAVALAYNLPGAPQNLKFTGDAVAKIFLGQIKNWNDPAIANLNPGVKLPVLPITVAHRSDGSGTTNIFTNFLASASNDWKTQLGAGKTVEWPVGLGGKGNDGVSRIVKQAPGGLGYVELAFAKQNKLSYASVKNRDGQFVLPSVEATTAAAQGSLPAVQKNITAPIANAPGAKAYPIAGFTYILVYKTAKNPAKGAALKDFLSWAIHDGQKEAASLDYAPLPPEVVALNEKIIAQLK